MAEETGNNAEKVPSTNEIDSRCVVKFRPTDSWEGEFGFDWFRTGDCNEKINGEDKKSRYRDIVGKYDIDPDHGPGGVLELRKYEEETTKWFYYVNELIEKEYTSIPVSGTNNGKYMVPHLSLFFVSIRANERRVPSIMLDTNNTVLPSCITSAALKLIIKAENISKIFFEYPGNLEVSPSEIEVSPSEINDIKNKEYESKIMVSFNREFTKDQDASIKVFAVHKGSNEVTFAGQIEVMKYYPIEMKVCFVKVRILLNNNPYEVPNTWIDEQKISIYKYFAQAHIIPTFSPVVCLLDLSNRTNFSEFYDKYHRIIIGKNHIINNPNSDLHEYLKRKLGEQCEDSDNGYFKVFVFDTLGGYSIEDGYVTGEANGIPSKSCVIFAEAIRQTYDDASVSHELIHCLGLYHTFSNMNNNHPFSDECNSDKICGKKHYTFKKLETSNIMDYSTNKKSLNKYQWEKMRNGLFKQESQRLLEKQRQKELLEKQQKAVIGALTKNGTSINTKHYDVFKK
jgi:hypothetical protein